MKLIPKIHSGSSLTDAFFERIKKVVTRTEQEVANDILALTDDVIVLIDTNPNMIDPNIGVGGYTDDKNHIQLSIDPDHNDLDDKEIFATLVHELSHVKRAYGPSYGTTLFDYIVFEGLGVAFEEEVCGPNTYYPNHLRRINDAKQLIETLAPMFDYDDAQYDYMDFVTGNAGKNIPEFAVYSMGLFVIDRYLAQTQKKASELLTEQSEIFRTI